MLYAIGVIVALAALAGSIASIVKWWNMPKVENEKTDQQGQKQGFILRKIEERRQRIAEKRKEKEQK